MSTDIGVVVIGRNEGPRLRRCLASVAAEAAAVVYVDSGSADDSRDIARSLGVDLVDLDTSVPFTAARARNAGFDRLRQVLPDVRYVQFVDGDCEVCPGWLAAARAELDKRPDLAVAAGRLRERCPGASVYNRLCDIEWDGPVGDVPAVGGIAMMRAAAVAAVGGYDPAVVAAEDDEICLRLRRAGGKVARLPVDMALHDAAMTRGRQWWKRAVRCGFAYALGAAMHGRGPERHFVRQRRRAVVWGLTVPAAAVALAPLTGGGSLALFGFYPLMAAKAYRATRRRVAVRRHAALYAASCVLAKVPEAVGVVKYHADRARRRPARLIEHK